MSSNLVYSKLIYEFLKILIGFIFLAVLKYN